MNETGSFYQASEAERVLRSHRRRRPPSLAPKHLAHFARTQELEPRFNTGLPMFYMRYSGPLYLQGRKPTCIPWTVVNGLSALGEYPYPDKLADLLNFALWEKGMSFHEALRLSEGSPGESVVLDRTDDRETLRRAARPPAAELRPQNDLRLTEWSKVVIDNARRVSQIVGRNSVGLISICTSEFLGITDNRSSFHAVCLSGFDVNSKGMMDVQILDSARGVVWTSIEHLTGCLRSRQTYRLTKVA